MSQKKDKDTLFCSFCGKSQKEVKKLIAGPTVFICDECVELCMDIIKEDSKNNQTKIFLHSNELLASGGYWAALASDKIYASYGAMIGSIGVRGPDWIYYDNPVSISTGILGQTVETKKGIKKFIIKSKDAINSMEKFPGVPGRLEQIKTDISGKIFID